jgi:hypothetical protein
MENWGTVALQNFSASICRAGSNGLLVWQRYSSELRLFNCDLNRASATAWLCTLFW